ncbi:unnamed protein product [Closterium sp. NIES-54]
MKDETGGAAITDGAGGTGGTATTGPGGALTNGAGAAGTSGVGCAVAGDPTEPGGAGAGGARVGGPGVGGAGATGAGVGGTSARGAGAAGAGAVDPGGGERREPVSRHVSPVCTARRAPRLRPSPVPGTHAMALRPSSIPLRVPLPAPPESSLPEVPDPASVSARTASPTISRLLATAVTDPSFEYATSSALVAELLDFAAACRLDYATALVAESVSASPPSVGGESALGTDVLEDRTTLAALGFAPSTADPSLFLHTDISLSPFYVLMYVDDLVFAKTDIEALTLVKSELHKRHTYTDLGELHSYLGLQITRDRARCTITQTQSHMVHQVLQHFGFQFSSPQPTPLSTSHSLSAPPSGEFVEPSGPYPELVGCLMYPLSLLARYVAPSRHRKVHWDAMKRVLRYLCSTPGMRLVLGGRGLVVLTGHVDASWVDDSATQRPSQGYTFSLGSSSVS